MVDAVHGGEKRASSLAGASRPLTQARVVGKKRLSAHVRNSREQEAKRTMIHTKGISCGSRCQYQQEIRYGGGAAAEGRERASPYFFVAAPNFLLHDPISYMYTHVCV